MRIKPGKKTRPRLAATRLGDESAIEAHAISGETIKIGRAGIGVSVAPEFGAVVLGDDEEDVGARRIGERCVGGEQAGGEGRASEAEERAENHK